MSYIEGVARDALQAAHTDLAKARRTLLPVAGVLALIHLLTVYPYLEASREIAGIEATMAANAGLLAQLSPEIEALQEAGADAGVRLSTLLEGVTAEMVGRFADLRTLVARALEGEPLAALPPDPRPPRRCNRCRCRCRLRPCHKCRCRCRRPICPTRCSSRPCSRWRPMRRSIRRRTRHRAAPGRSSLRPSSWRSWMRSRPASPPGKS